MNKKNLQVKIALGQAQGIALQDLIGLTSILMTVVHDTPET
jgi:hypothetical protein